MRIHTVTFATIALGIFGGCAGQVSAEPVPVAPAQADPVYVEGPAPAPPPPPVAAAPPAPPPPAPAPPDADLVYDVEPPVDIQTYPSVVYEGAPAYFVGGYWYREGPRGWGRLRAEPPELGRARMEHDRDPRWARARSFHPAPRRGVAEPQPPRRGDERR